MTRVKVDARRLLCPLPVIRVQDRAVEMDPGDEIEAICTDPGAMQDIPAWCRVHGHQILEKRKVENEYLIVVRIGDHHRE
ncbi:MAG: SirA family protein [Gammaproteobacteria bacterium RIFOXYD12_FULL_61_37]|nr:MAG: SirA family protein [Gammaproteobacteria bacterium RIFOXYD12_FULL_61_37]